MQSLMASVADWFGARMEMVSVAPEEGIVTAKESFRGVFGVAYSHIVLSGLCLLAACWHWLYWDLELFRDPQSGVMRIDPYPVFTDLVRRAIEELVK